ncbi:MAG: hypothetical protein WDO14_16505 [Bacteroidota bacterium]
MEILVELVDEPVKSLTPIEMKANHVTEMDKFKLAKNILLAALFLYIGIILLFAFSLQLCINEPMKAIWSFSSQGLFGIINLIIGFYFGGKIAGDSNMT